MPAVHVHGTCAYLPSTPRSPHASHHRYESDKIEEQIKNSSLYKLKVSHSNPRVLAVIQRCPRRHACLALLRPLSSLRFTSQMLCSFAATSNDWLFFQAFREKRASLSDFDRFKVPCPLLSHTLLHRYSIHSAGAKGPSVTRPHCPRRREEGHQGQGRCWWQGCWWQEVGGVCVRKLTVNAQRNGWETLAQRCMCARLAVV